MHLKASDAPARSYEVYADNHKVTMCTEANEEEGWVLTYNAPDPAIVHNYVAVEPSVAIGRPLYKVYGQVELRPVP